MFQHVIKPRDGKTILYLDFVDDSTRAVNESSPGE
jgi:hypothetical protein